MSVTAKQRGLSAAALSLALIALAAGLAAVADCANESLASVQAAGPAQARAGTRSSGYVDSGLCARCHEKEYRAWRGSHHDLAMQVATDETVLGDFDDAAFTRFGVTSRFFKRDGRFFVNTDGADGAMADFEVKYTFGVEWLQQYLIGFPGGRLQSLTIAWDTERRRWFDLYPQERIAAGDPLHWTGIYQNWNMMCADCHSTGLRKGYDAATDTYRSTWEEIDVGCQSCHGPGARHLAWAEARERREMLAGAREAGEGRPVEREIREPSAGAAGASRRAGESNEKAAQATAARESGEYVSETAEGGVAPADDPLMGLAFTLREPVEGSWVLDTATMKYKRSVPLASNTEVETCAPCHSRRQRISDSVVPGAPLLDGYLPSRLDDPLYASDGQMIDEVYVYGSFVQSKMYHKGVRCSDCHDSHSLKLRYSADSVCMSCHLSNVYDVPEHHFHKPDSAGSLCVECHMPARTYMQLDARRDHSIRIPRPDLTLALGAFDACSRCHNDKPLQWSADAAAKWYGAPGAEDKHYGEAIAHGRSHAPAAAAELVALLRDREKPAIVRATALDLLGGYDPSTEVAIDRRATGAAASGAKTGAAASDTKTGAFGSQPSAGIDARDSSADGIGSASTVGAELLAAMHEEDALLRTAAAGATAQWAIEDRSAAVAPLLADRIRSVRIEAARVLAAVPPAAMTREQRHAFDAAYAEFERAQMVTADFPSSRLNLAVAQAARGQIDAAEGSYRGAIYLDPTFLPARFNLANLYNRRGDNLQAEQLLREGILRAPKAPAQDRGELHYSLGLLLAEEQRLDEAIAELGAAARLLPERPRVRRNYALSLLHAGRRDEAEAELLDAQGANADSPDILDALVVYYAQEQEWQRARQYAEKLVELVPEAPGPREMLRQITAQMQQP